MGALDNLLSGPRVQDAFLLRLSMEPPWSLSVEDEAPLTVMAQLEGHAWVIAGAERMRLEPGDVAVAKGPDHYRVADDPETPISIVVDTQQQCRSLDGRSLVDEMLLGVRTWGNDIGGSAQMLVGTYNLDSEVSRRLLRALPPHLRLRADEWDSPLVGLLAAEVSRERPGQEVILDRTLDLLLMTAVRAWFDRPEHDAPGWYQAESDEAIGATIRLIHEQPQREWTVAELAAQAGMSRAAFARRFNEVVGEPPMTYLTNWRLTLAADLLREPDATVSDVAERVGYATPFGLSAAFKRVRGVSPSQYRQAVSA
ncbi:MAG: AraC family transcriptional regulator [Candidatus Limnocylindrales bacterium]